MARPPSFTNYAKLVSQAEKSKKEVKTNQLKAMEKWHRKLGKKASKLDATEKKLRNVLVKIKAAQKAKEDQANALSDFIEIVTEAYKELQLYTSVDPSQPLPPPKNISSLVALSVFIVPLIAYIVGVKLKMAMAAAIAKRSSAKP